MRRVAYAGRVSQWRIQDEHKRRECKHGGARLTTLPNYGNVIRLVSGHTLDGRVYSLLFFLCPVTDISATVAPIGLEFCMMVHRYISTWTDLLPDSCYGAVPRGDHPNPKFWALDSKLEIRLPPRLL